MEQKLQKTQLLIASLSSSFIISVLRPHYPTLGTVYASANHEWLSSEWQPGPGEQTEVTSDQTIFWDNHAND